MFRSSILICCVVAWLAAPVTSSVTAVEPHRKLMGSGSFSVTNSAICKASSTSTSMAKAQGFFERIVATVVAKTCKNGLYDLVNGKDTDHAAFVLMKEAYAQAYAQVKVDASAICSTNGNAYGCAAAHASAESFAKSCAKAAIKIIAIGIAKCDCLNPTYNASIDHTTCKSKKCVNRAATKKAVKSRTAAAAVTKIFIDLTARANASVDLFVCAASSTSNGIEGTSKIDLKGGALCEADAQVHLFITAIARAFARMNCNKMKAKTDAEVTAILAADVTYSAECTEYATGSSRTSGGSLTLGSLVQESDANVWVTVDDRSETEQDDFDRDFQFCFGTFCVFLA